MQFWWQDKLIYQIYPLSFCDSNGDGIGDLPGIISMLDYLRDLGVDMIWLSPIYPSPNRDNGYDISNYKDIHPNFGSLEDFDCLVTEAARRNIRIIMDLVINHTSDQHEWFQKSRQKIEPYTDYYIWQKGDRNKKPNNWGNFFGEDPWEFDDLRGEWYLHLFAKEQPDLNYNNPQVIQEVEDVMTFWLDRGIAGFRCDVINILYKETLANGKWRPALTGSEHYISKPGLHNILRGFRDRVWSKYDAYVVGETVFVTTDMAKDLTLPERRELSSVFSFEHMETDCFKIKWFLRSFSPNRFYKTLIKWQKALDWNTLYFENHDQPRSVSRFGDDQNYRVESAKALAILLLGLRGNVFIYQGQEIGMTNFDFESMDQLQDIESHNIWDLGRKLHLPKKLLWKMMKTKSRDNARTPMQWSSQVNAGFSKGEPWLGLNQNYQEINVEAALKDKKSIWHFYKDLITFRKENPAFIEGDFRVAYLKGSVMAFTRELGKESYFIILNLSAKERKQPYSGAALFSSYPDKILSERIRPYEAVILKTK